MQDDVWNWVAEAFPFTPGPSATALPRASSLSSTSAHATPEIDMEMWSKKTPPLLCHQGLSLSQTEDATEFLESLALGHDE